VNQTVTIEAEPSEQDDTVPGGVMSHRVMRTGGRRRGRLDLVPLAHLGDATGFRNLVAHRQGAVDWGAVHRSASDDLALLDRFCGALVRSVDPQRSEGT